MWWLFEKQSEDAGRVTYSYSRESKALDGVIVYDKAENLCDVVTPCADDEGNEWCINKAIDKFAEVVNEGFPQRTMIAIG